MKKLELAKYAVVCILLIIVIYLFGTLGCAPLPKTQEPQPSVPTPTNPPDNPPKIGQFSWDKVKDGPKWSQFALDETKKFNNLLTITPRDHKEYCPNFSKLSASQRAEFWTHWVSELAKFESSHKTETLLYECRKDRCVYGTCINHPVRGFCMAGGHRLDGGLVVSRGLTQMSLASSQALGCDVREPKDLHDPFKNISCALRAMNRYLGQDQSLFDIDGNKKWDGCSKYWAVCRGTNDYTKKAKNSIQNAVKKTQGCY